MASLDHPLRSIIVLQPPQFFKIVLQRNLEHKKLMIPKKFITDYGKFLSTSVRLRLLDGMEWKIGLTTAANGAVWLQNGWHPFAEHYSLEFGSLLVFRFDGCSTFHTTIFDVTGSEIKYRSNFNDPSGDFEEADYDDYSHESLQQREKPSFLCQEFYIYRKKRSCKRMREEGVSRRRQALSSTAKKAEEHQRFSSLKSGKPGFAVVMGKSNVGRGFCLIIPKEFAEKYLVKEFGTIGIQTLDGRSWSLLYKWSRSQVRDYAYISDGWKSFAEENLLKEGDVGFFQLIKKDKLLFQTIKYRCNFDDSSGDFEEEEPSFPCRKKMKNEGLVSPKMEPQDAEECYIYRKDEVSRRRQSLSCTGTAKKAGEPQRFSNLKSGKPGFKVILGKSYITGRCHMMIPKKFADKYLLEEFGTIGIQTSDGRNWTLFYKWSRTQVRDYAYISDGWKRFVQENLLKEGDVGFFQLIKKDQLLFSKQEICSISASPSILPKTNVATTGNPFFQVDVRFRRLRNPILKIPMDFTKEHLSPEMHTARLEMGKKQWKVSMENHDRRIRFLAGWPAFCKDNALKDGDTCFFELLDKNHSHCAFEVTIFSKFSSSVSVD